MATVRFATGNGKKVNMAELAGIFGVDVTTIRKCIAQGMPHKKINQKRYEFDTAACLHWKLKVELDKQSQATPNESSEGLTYEEAKTRKESAQALLAELELAKARGEVANIDDIMRNVESALSTIRSKLVGMPTRLSGLLAYMDSEQIEELIEKDITETLEQLSDHEHIYS